jgi:hypothetical protein
MILFSTFDDKKLHGQPRRIEVIHFRLVIAKAERRLEEKRISVRTHSYRKGSIAKRENHSAQR